MSVVDPALSIRIVSVRELRYTADATDAEDRPAHVRAGSGLAFANGRLVVVQDDAAFLATVATSASGDVAAIPLPRGAGGRRRFEVALGNKLDKLDLEACVAVDGELWAFGSGSLDIRERIVVIEHGVPRVVEAGPLYRRMRDELGALNIEGVAVVGDQLWLFHRGNCGPADPGPAIVRFPLAAFTAWLRGTARVPEIAGTRACDLGAIAGVRLGFTDAVGIGARAFYLAAAEASPNAVDDGHVVGSQLGVIDDRSVRAAPLDHDGTPLKAEGLALDPADPRHGWVVVDPDDPERPSQLFEIALEGDWPATEPATR